MPEDYRPTEPVHVYESHGEVPRPVDDDEFQPPRRPERSGKNNSLLWIGVVVLVFMAVPLFANFANRTPARAKAPAAASAPLAVAEPASAERPAPEQPTAAQVPDRPAPLPARPPADPTKQMVTKCIERGRVVYTQTGECAGSVSAVPIDASKNVVGPGRDAPRTSP